MSAQEITKEFGLCFSAPNSQLVTEEIESKDEDGEPMYQNQKVQFYSGEK